MDLTLFYQRGLPVLFALLSHCSLIAPLLSASFHGLTTDISFGLKYFLSLKQSLIDNSGGSNYAGEHAGNASSVDAPATGKRQTILETLEALVLEEIFVKGFARFLADRKKYENEISEKNKE